VPEWNDATAVALALLFHDAVYEAGRTDNEALSAALAEQLIREYLPLLAPRLPRVKELVLLTAQHGQHARAALDLDAAHFLDCDMAILGAAAPRYDAYERAIAEEYQAIPAELYRAGRARFLAGLLASPSIYLTTHFRERCERSARTNLARALAALSG
jgi:predicted metal-dependent HD superfamily phosphohydrolase